MQPGKFLTAEWRWLAMLNYEIDPAILRPLVPRGTELDEWQGSTFVSMVGFMFLDTKLLGLPIPFHRHFEEVNLRFYVRRKAPDGWRRGVVFVKELVPKRAIAATARIVYHENYEALPMRHQIEFADEAETRLKPDGAVAYGWQKHGRWHSLRVRAAGEPQPLSAGSEAEFITEHYWGYAVQRAGDTIEYQVEHPSWRVWQVSEQSFDCDVATIYGQEFIACLSGPPSSAFLAEGSAIVVRRGVRL